MKGRRYPAPRPTPCPKARTSPEPTFTARDPEDTDAAVTSWRLAGSDAGDFTITDTGQNSAQLTFRNTPDYDRPADSNRDNEYLVTIRAYNGSTYGSLGVTVTVTDRNEAEPVVTGRDTLSFRENTAAGTRLYTYRATDTDRNTDDHLVGGGSTDENAFAISTGGEFWPSGAPPDYEQACRLRTRTTCTKSRWLPRTAATRGTMAVTVTVTDVNEGPEIAGTQSLSFAENTAYRPGPVHLHRQGSRGLDRRNHSLERHRTGTAGTSPSTRMGT